METRVVDAAGYATSCSIGGDGPPLLHLHAEATSGWGPLDDALNDTAEPLAPAQRRRLDLTHRNALRLLKLVNSLLDFSRIEAGRVQASYLPTDLSRLTLDLAGVFESTMAKGGLAYAVEAEDLGEPVWVDRDMWEKIVFNLLSNAFKFTLAGSVTVRLARVDGMALDANGGQGNPYPRAADPSNVNHLWVLAKVGEQYMIWSKVNGAVLDANCGKGRPYLSDRPDVRNVNHLWELRPAGEFVMIVPAVRLMPPDLIERLP